MVIDNTLAGSHKLKCSTLNGKEDFKYPQTPQTSSAPNTLTAATTGKKKERKSFFSKLFKINKKSNNSKSSKDISNEENNKNINNIDKNKNFSNGCLKKNESINKLDFKNKLQMAPELASLITNKSTNSSPSTPKLETTNPSCFQSTQVYPSNLYHPTLSLNKSKISPQQEDEGSNLKTKPLQILTPRSFSPSPTQMEPLKEARNKFFQCLSDTSSSFTHSFSCTQDSSFAEYHKNIDFDKNTTANININNNNKLNNCYAYYTHCDLKDLSVLRKPNVPLLMNETSDQIHIKNNNNDNNINNKNNNNINNIQFINEKENENYIKEEEEEVYDEEDEEEEEDEEKEKEEEDEGEEFVTLKIETFRKLNSDIKYFKSKLHQLQNILQLTPECN